MVALTRVLVVDDHPVSGAGAATLLADAGFTVVGTAADLDTAIQLAIREVPDVILSDVMLGEEPLGLDLPAKLVGTPAESCAFVYLSSYTAPFFLARAVSAAASGYLSKSSPAAKIAEAVRVAAAGGVSFPAAVLRSAAAHHPPSPRERQIVALVCTGAANSEIGLRLHISDKTVETHLANLFARYSVTSRTQLASLARGQGWVSPDGLA